MLSRAPVLVYEDWCLAKDVPPELLPRDDKRYGVVTPKEKANAHVRTKGIPHEFFVGPKMDQQKLCVCCERTSALPHESCNADADGRPDGGFLLLPPTLRDVETRCRSCPARAVACAGCCLSKLVFGKLSFL